MKTLLRLLLKTQFKPNGSKVNRTIGGFTLIELLVAMIMTFLILTPLLAFVVDVLNTDRKEQVKSNTEQEVQAAIDFISEDLGQAVYIYDKEGVTAIAGKLPHAANTNAGTPVLVFWKRQLMKRVLPANSGSIDCDPVGSDTTCNDSYVFSLVAYYLRTNNTDQIWCQPSGVNCPYQITRYQYRDGVINTNVTPPAYFTDTDRKANPDNFVPFSLSISGVNLQAKMNQWPLQVDGGTSATISVPDKQPQVLVNYIDRSTVNATAIDECQKALGSPKLTNGSDAPEGKLRISTGSNSFYACVDSDKTVARVTIRGNALRKMQTNANYSSANSAFFPTVSVQVQGLGILAN